jgi:hypothetical protein
MIKPDDLAVLRAALREAEEILQAVPAGVDVKSHVATGLRPVREALERLSIATELEAAALYGDAFRLQERLPNGQYVVPDRVKGAPLLVYDLRVFCGETNPQAGEVIARDAFDNQPPVLIKGRLEGMKDLMCRDLHQDYLEVTKQG